MAQTESFGPRSVSASAVLGFTGAAGSSARASASWQGGAFSLTGLGDTAATAQGVAGGLLSFSGAAQGGHFRLSTMPRPGGGVAFTRAPQLSDRQRAPALSGGRRVAAQGARPRQVSTGSRR